MNQRRPLDDRSPIYRQLADQLRDEIVSGLLVDDEQVMSTNQFASFFRINPATVAKAFQELVDQDLIYKKRGLGMFVTPGAQQRLLADRRARFVEERVRPLVDEAERLGISIDEVVAALRARRDGDRRGTP